MFTLWINAVYRSLEESEKPDLKLMKHCRSDRNLQRFEVQSLELRQFWHFKLHWIQISIFSYTTFDFFQSKVDQKINHTVLDVLRSTFDEIH